MHSEYVPQPLTRSAARIPSASSRPPRFAALETLRQQPLLAASALLLLLFAFAALAAPWLAPADPAYLDLPMRLQPPSSHHFFGTDELGRDIFSRVLFGSQVSLIVACSVTTLSLVTGLVLGGVAGFFGGWADVVINVYLLNAFLALPGILLAIALVAFLGPGLLNVVVALSLSGWVNYARLTRAEVSAVKQREYVEAARALGAGNLRLFFRHTLPNIWQPLIVQSAIGMASAVLAEATLSFLGLGIPPPRPSWGSMLNDARSHLFDAPHLLLFPAAAVVLLVLAFNFLGDALRDFMDPRLRSTLESAQL